MRSHGVSIGLVAVLVALAVSGCGGSSATSNGAAVNSSAIRKQLEQAITSSAAGIKPAQANKIVDCILTKMGAAGIKTNAEAESHQNQVEQFSESCTEKVLTPGS
jgi:cytochrome c556